MIAVDTNILVYAHFEDLPLHARAEQRLRQLAQSPDAWGLPLFCVGEFLRVVTHPRLFDNPYTPDEAAEALERLLRSPSLVLLVPTERFKAMLLSVIRELQIKGNPVFDAQIGALCREHGVTTLLPEDRDFDRFTGLQIERL